MRIPVIGVMTMVTALLLTPSCGNSGRKSQVSVEVAKADVESDQRQRGVVVKKETDVQESDVTQDVLDPEQLADRQRSRKVIHMRAGEDFALYSNWLGVPVREIQDMNVGKQAGYGAKIALSLSAAEYENFELQRKEYWDNKEKEYLKSFDVTYKAYTVKPGDTMDSIRRKAGIPLWLLANANPTIDPNRLSKGVSLRIPMVTPRKRNLPEDQVEDVEDSGDDESSSVKGKDGKDKNSKKKKDSGSKGGKTSKGSKSSDETEAVGVEGIPIKVKPGEKLHQYCKWGGFSLEDLERLNPGITNPGRMLKADETILLPLTPEQFEEFQTKRLKGGDKKSKGKEVITPPGDVPPKSPSGAPSGENL